MYLINEGMQWEKSLIWWNIYLPICDIHYLICKTNHEDL